MLVDPSHILIGLILPMQLTTPVTIRSGPEGYTGKRHVRSGCTAARMSAAMHDYSNGNNWE